ncbi:LLM class flavin-dependent oxidoreductase [Microvirga sp. KLBC 81]|uniref:LLM class flavin-dependent oxidoreductase n=1 Tax=Microvirga sp. KLBC 81 TaxID=1862707 RepID=UPI000D50DA8A|nr:LLM class flavin-dependent oxidoreductase [Microvirga sp. KLBC 81]PVE22950.1 LLM class flavin-dependent oxidoreductase [Microvirga sp. KLBC 81]
MALLSILDIVPVPEGATPKDALHNSLNLARSAERWGYHRYWIAEHHNMVGAAGAATGTVVGFIAAGTSTIRVGAGGIMLPNHAPLVVAEQFGTLECLYPGRIDLGLGRAPGTDQFTARALRRDAMRAQEFPQEVIELQHFFAQPQPQQIVQAVPGAGLDVPIWVLGSGETGASVAASLGLPFAFASHFAPSALTNALEVYRSGFSPSAQLAAPYVMLGVNVVIADTQEEAERIFTSVQQRFINIVRGEPRKLPPPVDNMAGLWSPEEKARVSSMLTYSFVGTAEVVKDGLDGFLEMTKADELIVSATVFDPAARLRSYELLADLW